MEARHTWETPVLKASSLRFIVDSITLEMKSASLVRCTTAIGPSLSADIVYPLEPSV